jgi:hypothetical protein
MLDKVLDSQSINWYHKPHKPQTIKEYSMNYSVCHGINNSHLTECSLFNLYREALDFFTNNKSTSAVVFKLHYDAAGYVQKREAKKWRSEQGKSNTAFLESLR